MVLRKYFDRETQSVIGRENECTGCDDQLAFYGEVQ